MTISMHPPRSRPPVYGPPPTCPYVGLVPFSENDTAYFFGRDRESDVIVANLTAARLTLLYAPSGVGKSSVLRAGVVPSLRELADEDDDEELGIARSAVAYVSEWSSAPLEAAAAEIERALAASRADSAPETVPPSSLGPDWLRGAMRRAGVGVLYLILDQFEEYLFYHPADSGSDELTKTLSEILASPDLDVHVLLSVREDALAGLDRFKGRVPHLFGNYLRLAHLTREAACSAIEGPVAMYNQHVAADQVMSVEPMLVEELLDQVRTGHVVVGRDGGASDAVAANGRGDIETPYLQLVLTRLWEQERSRGSRSIRRHTLDELGGAQTIVQSHLDTVIAGLSPDQVEVAAAIFQHLVTASGSKIALTAGDLADWSGQPVVPVQDLLEALSSGGQRILRPVPPAAEVTGPPRYEIFHDVMGDAVLDWRRQYMAKRQQEIASRRLVAEREQAEEAARTAKRQLRFTLVSVGLVVLLLVTAGLGVTTYWSFQRSKQQQRLGEAAVALEQNPELSLRKALEAFQLGDNSSSRSAVLTAASSPRGRIVAGPGEKPHDMAVAGVDVTNGGEHLVAFDMNGHFLVHHASGTADTERFVTGLKGQVSDVATAPDATRVVVATDRGELTVVDVGTGTQREVPTRSAIAADVAWLGQAANGLLLVSAPGSAATYDATTGAEIARFPGNVRGVADLDGQRIVTSSADNRLRVWDARSGQLLEQSPVLHETPTFLQRYKGSVVGLSRTSKEIVVWDYTTGADPLRHPFPYSDGVSDLAVDEATDSVRIASDKEVWTFKLADGTFSGLLPQQPRGVVDIDNSPVGAWVATVGQDGRVLVWCTRTTSRRPVQPTYELPGNGSAVEKVEYLRDGSLIAKSADGRLRRWNLPTPPRLKEHSDWVRDIDLSHDGRWLATASADGYGNIVSTADITTSVSRFGSGHAIAAVKIDPSDTHRLFTIERRARMPVMWRWDENGASEGPITFDQPPLRAFHELVSIDVSPDGMALAAGDTAGNVYIWDTGTGRLQPDRGLPGTGYPASSIAFDPAGHQLATTVQEGIRLIDTSTGAEQVLDHPNAISVDFDAAGGELVSVADGGTVRVWRRDGTPLQDLVAHTSRLGRASFSQDGALLAVGTADGLAEVWDVRSGTTLALTRQHGDSVNKVLFAPGSRYRLLMASDDTTVTAWDCSACDDPEAAILAAAASVGTG
jgi:WD40 repeat protein